MSIGRYYIDGYNVIHHCERLRPLAQENFEAARDALVERVAHYCAAVGARAIVVFDGRGHTTDTDAGLPSAPGLSIVFSPKNQTADALIERAIYSARDRRDIVVVSADRGIRDLCGGLGALTMQPENFLASIDMALSQARASLDATQGGFGRTSVEDRLDADAVKRLRDLKKRLPE